MWWSREKINEISNLLFSFLGLTSSVYAAELGGNANLFKIADCETLLTYRGVPIVTTYVGYNDGENTYPAYCLNVNLPGVGEAKAKSIVDYREQNWTK